MVGATSRVHGRNLRGLLCRFIPEKQKTHRRFPCMSDGGCRTYALLTVGRKRQGIRL